MEFDIDKYKRGKYCVSFEDEDEYLQFMIWARKNSLEIRGLMPYGQSEEDFLDDCEDGYVDIEDEGEGAVSISLGPHFMKLSSWNFFNENDYEILSIEDVTKRKTKFKKEQKAEPKTKLKEKKTKTKQKETEMDYVENFKSSVSKAMKTSKDSALTQQKGDLVISSFRELILSSPVHESIKQIVSNEIYGDLVIGLALNIIVPTLDVSQKANEAVDAANAVAAMKFSSQFTFIQDTVKNIINKIEIKSDDKEEN